MFGRFKEWVKTWFTIHQHITYVISSQKEQAELSHSMHASFTGVHAWGKWEPFAISYQRRSCKVCGLTKEKDI